MSELLDGKIAIVREVGAGFRLERPGPGWRML
jgi:hypothetical protein